MKQVTSVVLNIPAKGGGVTRVALRRAQEFARRGFISRIATLGYRPRLGTSYLKFWQQKIIGPDVQVFNFYTWFAMRSMGIDPHLVKNTQSHTHTPWWIVERATAPYDRDAKRNWKQHTYINPCGQVFMEEYVTADEKIMSVIIRLPGEPGMQFFDDASAHAYWLEQLVADAMPAILLTDHVEAADAVGMIKMPSLYKTLVIHNTHLLQPDPSDSPVVPVYGGFARNVGRCDSVVVLTQEQLRDIQARFPEGRYCTIGDPIVVPKAKEVEREPDLVVVVARLVAQKRIDAIINAFEKVLRIKPTARLEIWGEGEMEQELKDLIEAKGLSGSVALMGFAVDVGSVFRRASASLAMSWFEGFGMTLAESLACGTPVVSLKTKYGPEEIITSGKDGFLVDNEDEFVEKVVELLSNPDLVKKMGAVGVRNMKRFSVKNIVDLWIEHFTALLAQAPLPADSEIPERRFFPVEGLRLPVCTL